MLPWIHPHLTQSVHPLKGRELQASKRIQKGEVLLIDPPYAIIPTPGVDSNTSTTDKKEEKEQEKSLLCSNPQCNALIALPRGSPCPNNCSDDVIWCHDVCRLTDKPRHDFECVWLKKYRSPISSKWGEYNFGMLWLIVRILARRYTEQTSHSDQNPHLHLHLPPDSPLHRFRAGWRGIEGLCGTVESWSHAQVREWTVLVKKYLNFQVLPHNLPNEAVLGLICQEEANSFGLYPRETGVFEPPPLELETASVLRAGEENESLQDKGRGEQFGAAVYPRASIANHSCLPNLSHKPDKHSRIVFTASRDISPGEECCIAYFDMTQKVTLSERRGHLASLFRFKCGCVRCQEDEKREEEGKGHRQGNMNTDNKDKDGDGDGDENGDAGGWDAFPDLD